MTATQAKIPIKSDVYDVIGYCGEICIQRLIEPEIIESEWKELQKAETGCIYQNYDWVRIACNTFEKGNSIYIITARAKDALLFILPMVLVGTTFKTLRWIGGTHANICSGLYSEQFLKSDNKKVMQDVFNLLGKFIKGISRTGLTNQPLTLKSHPNPMIHLPQQSSVNLMYDMDLREGMDAILDHGSGKRKRKLWRKQNRVAESMGGCELVLPTSARDITEALDEFFESKTKRLKELGVRDVFSDQNTIDFMRQLAAEPEHDGVKLLQIFQLKIADKTRAMYAIGINGKYCQAYVNAVEYDDFADHSPGEMVLYAMIEHLIAHKYERFDLGVGDERYKRSWCPGMHDLFDTMIPLSAASTPLILGLRLKNSLKRYIRNNPDIWGKFKKLRKARASLLSRD